MKISADDKNRLLEIEKNLKEWEFPPQVIIETTSYCNMKCLHCNHKTMKRKPRHMPDSLFKKIVDEIASVNPDAEVWPTFYGEALILGDQLFSWLDYARGKGLRNMVLNSNGILLGRGDIIEQILHSGLKRFILSLDGFSPETFEKIRIGGKRDEIYATVEKLLARKHALNLEYPVIQCQFSLMDENQHEVELFQKFWQDRGAEVKIRNMLSWGNTGEVVAKNLDYDPDFRITCPWGNSTAAIHTDGNLVACAVDYEGRFIAGNLENRSLLDLWQKEHYQSLRKPQREHLWDKIPEICVKCPDWQAVGARYLKNEEAEVKNGTRPFWHKD